MDAIHSMIMNDRKISAKKIVETLVISRERVDYIIHDILDTRKVLSQMSSQMSQC
jgi:coenzyme F420-reducing hydrogenase delta subunit